MIVVEAKRHILKLLPYLGCTLITTHFGEAWRMSAAYEEDLRIMGFIEMLPEAFSKILPSFHPFDLLIGVAFALLLRLIVYVKSLDAKTYRKGIEYGSARWGTKQEKKPSVLKSLAHFKEIAAKTPQKMQNRELVR